MAQEDSGNMGVDDVLHALSARINSMDVKIAEISAYGYTMQAQIVAHIAVCDERQRQTDQRVRERREWEEGRASEWIKFMEESRADRQRIRDSVQINAWRILIVVVGANIISLLGAIVSSHPGLLSKIP